MHDVPIADHISRDRFKAINNDLLYLRMVNLVMTVLVGATNFSISARVLSSHGKKMNPWWYCARRRYRREIVL